MRTVQLTSLLAVQLTGHGLVHPHGRSIPTGTGCYIRCSRELWGPCISAASARTLYRGFVLKRHSAQAMGREGKRGGRGKGRGGPQNTGTDQYGDDHFDRDDAPPSFGGRGGRAGGGGDDDASTSYALPLCTARGCAPGHCSSHTCSAADMYTPLP